MSGMRRALNLSLPQATGGRVAEMTMDLRCVACGYGVVVRIAPEACPMCQGGAWETSRDASTRVSPPNGAGPST